jgi:hypothetical protein
VARIPEGKPGSAATGSTERGRLVGGVGRVVVEAGAVVLEAGAVVVDGGVVVVVVDGGMVVVVVGGMVVVELVLGVGELVVEGLVVVGGGLPPRAASTSAVSEPTTWE